MSQYETGILTDAAYMNDLSVIEYVLKKHKDIDKKDLQFALVVAAAQDNTRIGNVLIEHGADINYGACTSFSPTENMKNGRPPIFNAAESGAVSFILLLASRGANLNVFEDRGYTPLVAAYYNCKEKLQEVIELLLGLGADPCLGWSEGTSFEEIYSNREKIDESISAYTIYRFNNAHVGSKLSLYSCYNRYGIRFNEHVIIPLYFSTVTDLTAIPYATYFIHKAPYDKSDREFILLHENILDNIDKRKEIYEYYSTAAVNLLYDKERGFFRIVWENYHLPSGIIKVFKNGLYYLYSEQENRILSYGYSELGDFFPECNGVLTCRLGRFYGFISIQGNELLFPILDFAWACISKGKTSGYIEYKDRDDFQFTFKKKKDGTYMIHSRHTSKYSVFKLLFQPFWILVYRIRGGNSEKAFIRRYHRNQSTDDIGPSPGSITP